MIKREIEKLACIENLINEVKEHGFGEIAITITDGQITFVKKTEAIKWELEVNPPIMVFKTGIIERTID